MRKWFILLVAMVLLVPAPVRAQDTAALKSMNVQLWSEFDQPSMLVIHIFEVTDDTQVPTTLDIPIPSEANITAVAYGSENNLLLANYQNKPGQNADWQVITIFITERTPYRVEYYLPLERDGNKRSFTYQWTGAYPISEFSIDVRVPQDSTNVKTSPAIPFVKEQPFLSGGATMNELQEGQTYQLKLEYSRTSEATVVTPSSSQVEPIAPVDENTEGRSTLNDLPLLLGGFGVMLILVALFFVLRGQSSANRTAKPHKRSQPAQESLVQIYCHECGARAHENDRFCRTCGSKLRVS
jgi:hypothetical protein